MKNDWFEVKRLQNMHFLFSIGQNQDVWNFSSRYWAIYPSIGWSTLLHNTFTFTVHTKVIYPKYSKHFSIPCPSHWTVPALAYFALKMCTELMSLQTATCLFITPFCKTTSFFLSSFSWNFIIMYSRVGYEGVTSKVAVFLISRLNINLLVRTSQFVETLFFCICFANEGTVELGNRKFFGCPKIVP